MVAGFWGTIGLAFDLTGAIALATLAIWLWPRLDRFGNAGVWIVSALFITAARP